MEKSHQDLSKFKGCADFLTISMFHTLSCPETHKTLSTTPIHKYISDHLMAFGGAEPISKVGSYKLRR